MDLVEIFFRATGAFYLFAGHVAARAMLVGAVTDRMIAILAEDREPEGAGRHLVLAISVVVTATSGAALALMSFWAMPLFVAGAVAHMSWVVFASPDTAPSRGSEARSERRRTVRAAIIYAIVSLGVLWLWSDGRLGPADDALSAGLVCATAIYFAAWLRRDLAWEPRPGEVFDDPDLPFEPALRPEKVRLDPCFGSWPLVDIRRGRRFNHLTWLPEDLAFRIEDWDDTFQGAFDGDDPAPYPDFGSAADAQAYVEEGRAIVLALCDHFGADNVEVSGSFDRAP